MTKDINSPVPCYIEPLLTAVDPGEHKTFEDLLWLVEHEVNLFDEGEESSITSAYHRTQAVRWLKRQRGQKRG